MNLQYLLPSLQSACSTTLTHAALGTLGPQAALALGFDKNEDPHVVFVSNTSEPICPPYVCSGMVFFRDLSDLTTKVAGLGLSHEESISRMIQAILALLPNHLASANTAQDARVWQLVGILSNYAVEGLRAGIAAQPPPAKTPALAQCERVQSN